MKKIYPLLLLAILCFGSNVLLADPGTQAQQVKIVRSYPNPATTVVNFEFNRALDKTYSLQIYNFIGKKVADIPVNSERITVSLDSYFRGLYIYQLRDRSGKIVESGKFQVIK